MWVRCCCLVCRCAADKHARTGEHLGSHIDIGTASCVLIAIMLALGKPRRISFPECHALDWVAYVGGIGLDNMQ